MEKIAKSSHKAAITGHWNKLKRQPLEIPEWGMTVFYDPLNCIERDELDQLEGGESEFHIQILIRKAMNEDGTPCFGPEDVGWMKREAAPNILKFAAVKILTADLSDVKTLGKPSAPPMEP